MNRLVTLSAALLTAAAATTAVAAPAQAAPTVSIKLACKAPHGEPFEGQAVLSGSGAPTAKYDVVISVFDRFDDNRAPKARLISGNKDGSVTHYPWHTGDQGASIQSYWNTSLQQPKGLNSIALEVTSSVANEYSLFYCSDVYPK